VRSNLNAAEHRHIVLGLIFLKYISATVEKRHQKRFLTQFASAKGKSGGQFDTPRCVVLVLVEMLAPYQGLRAIVQFDDAAAGDDE
jgi:type I restriction-modification system DNA methylase subunit